MRHSVLVGIVGGALTGVFLWILTVPWDLSEKVDAHGNQSGGDDNAGRIALTLASITSVGLALAVRRSTSRLAVPETIGAASAWTALFAWRAGVSEVSGASLFLIPLVFAVIPGAARAVGFVALIASAHLVQQKSAKANRSSAASGTEVGS